MVTLLPIFSPFSGLSISITTVLVYTSPTFLTGTGAPKPGQQRRTYKKDHLMRKKHTLPVIAGLLTGSAALIAGMASADMKSDHTKKSMMYAKKLDTNADGAISLDELTARQDRRFAKIDQNNNGLIDKVEFNARLVTMFTRMDQNGDGLLPVVVAMGLKFLEKIF